MADISVDMQQRLDWSDIVKEVFLQVVIQENMNMRGLSVFIGPVRYATNSLHGQKARRIAHKHVTCFLILVQTLIDVKLGDNLQAHLLAQFYFEMCCKVYSRL